MQGGGRGDLEVRGGKGRKAGVHDCSEDDRTPFGGRLWRNKRGSFGPLSLKKTEGTSHYKPARKVIDSTAAGDSFNGGYLGAILSNKSQTEALEAAHRLANVVLGHHGAIIPD